MQYTVDNLYMLAYMHYLHLEHNRGDKVEKRKKDTRKSQLDLNYIMLWLQLWRILFLENNIVKWFELNWELMIGHGRTGVEALQVNNIQTYYMLLERDSHR